MGAHWSSRWIPYSTWFLFSLLEMEKSEVKSFGPNRSGSERAGEGTRRASTAQAAAARVLLKIEVVMQAIRV